MIVKVCGKIVDTTIVLCTDRLIVVDLNEEVLIKSGGSIEFHYTQEELDATNRRRKSYKIKNVRRNKD